MFNNLGWGELAVLLVMGILIFGPERLPKVAADAGRLVRELRRMASGVQRDLRDELGVDVNELRKMDPRRFFDEDDAEAEAPAVTTPPLARGERAPYDPDAT